MRNCGARGTTPVGIRLDSGDLAYLSIQAARLLDAAGFPTTSIVLSNDLDELIIWQILTQITAEAQRYGVEPDTVINRLVYGVGTRLITSQGSPALGGVYKLVAVQTDGAWVPILKLSEAPEKTPNPGHKQVWRVYDARGQATADVLSLGDEDPRGWSRSSCTTRPIIPSSASSARPRSRAIEPLPGGDPARGAAGLSGSVYRGDARPAARRHGPAGPGRAALAEPAHLPCVAHPPAMGVEAAPDCYGAGPEPVSEQAVGGRR